ncbi:hypothetical protein H310_08221 [Aphanomyces invadans]|uniref:Fibronectin type-III domain-containing protein n=1 Tax=Aphanomyces invadans TaxID=157072 RepID=A0A024U1T1_9STRA|nr:hypothetical protein H310_08221 [Aphanomyces invadans]ETV99562.1 hypothetical protein H310_08221 [Aphanomyces invadans]|eukprot:XP_008872118.1 hypothetical protein H310_08221 [Aphanomyces invadans]
MQAADEPFAYDDLATSSDEAVQKALHAVLLKRKQYQAKAAKQHQKELDIQARSVERAVSMANIGALNEATGKNAPDLRSETSAPIATTPTLKSFQDFYPHPTPIRTNMAHQAIDSAPNAAATTSSTSPAVVKPPPNTPVPALATNTLLPPTPNVGAATFVGLVVVTTAFKHTPPLPDGIRAAATTLHTVLCDPALGGFLNQACKLLVNPSLIEFQSELATFETAVDVQSTFFLIIVTHGVRVVKEPHVGSYLLFSESRVSSVDELVVTSLHEHQLASAIDRIPSQRKLLAFDVCHVQNVLAVTKDDAPPAAIKGRIHEDFARKLLTRLRDLQTQRDVADAKANHLPIKSLPAMHLPVFVLEACHARSQVAVQVDAERQNAFFLRRFIDAFRGAAASPGRRDQFKNWIEDDAKFPYLHARDVVQYVTAAVEFDAYVASARAKKAIEAKDLLTVQFDEAASVREINQTPQLHCDAPDLDFCLGKVPRPPQHSPTPPTLATASMTSLQVEWTMPLDERTPVLGFQLERRGAGPACVAWNLVATRLIHTYEEVVRNRATPATTMTAVGLPADTAFCFRVRARNAGGWGPFSSPSLPVRTLAVSRSIGYSADVLTKRCPQDIVEWMIRYRTFGQVQQVGSEALAQWATAAFKGRAASEPKEAIGGIVDVALNAMKTFTEDVKIQAAAAHLLGAAAHLDIKGWTPAQKAGAKIVLDNVLSKFATFPSAHATGQWALRAITSPPQRRKLGLNEAAMKIQGMYRRRQARQLMATLARALFPQLVDPATGLAYYYDTRTGAATWTPPTRFLLS